MTANSTFDHDRLMMLDSHRTGQEVRGEDCTDLRQRIEALLREIFEGHEEYLGCTPD
jgi:hypothetical protein